VLIVTQFVWRISLDIYLLLWSYCLVSMNNAVILSNESFIRIPGNTVKLFDRHCTNKRTRILLRSIVFRQYQYICIHRQSDRFVRWVFFPPSPPSCVLHDEFYKCHDSNSDTKLESLCWFSVSLCAPKLSRLQYPLNTSWYGFPSVLLQSTSTPAAFI